jgi:hypothetical protein
MVVLALGSSVYVFRRYFFRRHTVFAVELLDVFFFAVYSRKDCISFAGTSLQRHLAAFA